MLITKIISIQEPDEVTTNAVLNLTKLPQEPDEVTTNNEYPNRHLSTKMALFRGYRGFYAILILLS